MQGALGFQCEAHDLQREETKRWQNFPDPALSGSVPIPGTDPCGSHLRLPLGPGWGSSGAVSSPCWVGGIVSPIALGNRVAHALISSAPCSACPSNKTQQAGGTPEPNPVKEVSHQQGTHPLHPLHCIHENHFPAGQVLEHSCQGIHGPFVGSREKRQLDPSPTFISHCVLFSRMFSSTCSRCTESS